MPDEEETLPAEQYFVERPKSRSEPRTLRFLYRGELLSFVADQGVFASRGLDPGTSLLIEHLGVGRDDRVLDLGCGWGAVGVAAAKSARAGAVVMTEVNRRAARLAERNLERNGVRNAEVRVGEFYQPVASERFDLIALNPPYRLGRPHVLRLLGEAAEHLTPEGRLVLVGKGSLGIRFYQEWLEEHWDGTVEVVGRGSGYRVISARRGSGVGAAPSRRSA